jgi:hypothetical protein
MPIFKENHVGVCFEFSKDGKDVQGKLPGV